MYTLDECLFWLIIAHQREMGDGDDAKQNLPFKVPSSINGNRERQYRDNVLQKYKSLGVISCQYLEVSAGWVALVDDCYAALALLHQQASRDDTKPLVSYTKEKFASLRVGLSYPMANTLRDDASALCSIAQFNASRSCESCGLTPKTVLKMFTLYLRGVLLALAPLELPVCKSFFLCLCDFSESGLFSLILICK
jgi:hypothetical protein